MEVSGRPWDGDPWRVGSREGIGKQESLGKEVGWEEIGVEG